ncbi:metal-dependent hydrolase [Natrinema pallidum]|uniref:Metal-dependent hydrolase n=1 Tax=Natrinema pallidum TaxID=69527 RepID=A0A4P9TD69_9EURY|nr:metal-dependent hydrolase [Natrinema pallidum]QCW02661.1 metal-dependent hydrolase [Natrinema pallidum]
MVATGVHILLSLALISVLRRSGRPEPYLVGALAAAVPDSDTFVFRPLVEIGYAGGVLWGHRGLTHSLLGGVVVIVLLSFVGPWRAAAIGFGSHVVFDFLSGGVRLLAPLDRTLYGLSFDWVLLNALTSVFAVTVLLGDLLGRKYGLETRTESYTAEPILEWLR